MAEDRKTNKVPRAEDIIAAFDQERAKLQELRRRHTEHVRASRGQDRPARGRSEQDDKRRDGHDSR